MLRHQMSETSKDGRCHPVPVSVGGDKSPSEASPDAPASGGPQMASSRWQHIKWLSLVFMTTQNASAIVMMRVSRVQSSQLYISSTPIVLQELFKFLACVVLVVRESGGVTGFLHTVNTQIIQQPVNTLKVAVPSFTYVIQNNLMYIAITHLSAAIYQVTYQSKIFTTGVFSVLMLNKKLSLMQWIALTTLFLGICVVQVEQQTGVVSVERSEVEQQPLLGLLACALASVISGFSGVYFERVLKSTLDVSVWVRNLQMSLISLPIAWLVMEAQHHHVLSQKGFFYGYTPLVWGVIFNHTFGGLLVGVVIKYADNILKGFATAVSILLSCVASIFLFNFAPTLTFCFGTTLVISSVFIYAQPGFLTSSKK